MILAIISFILLLVLILIAIRIGMNREKLEEEEIQDPLIHASGIYSIVRRSPREAVGRYKPSVEEIRKYLEAQNENIGKLSLSENFREAVLERWTQSINKNIEVIEQGDKEGVEFYYYDFIPEKCPICEKYLSKGHFVTREEIFQYPSIIPPFHIGCTCMMIPHHGKENLKETTELGMLPFFKQEILPALPDWKSINNF